MKALIINYKFSNYKGGDHRVQNLAKGLKEIGINTLYVSIYGASYDLEKIMYHNRNYLVRKYLDAIQKSKALAALSDAMLHPLLLLKTLLASISKVDENVIGIVSVPSLFKLLPLTILKKFKVLTLDFGDLWTTYTYVFHNVLGKVKYPLILDVLARTYAFIEEFIGLKIIDKLYKQHHNRVIVTTPTRIMSQYLKSLKLRNVYFLHYPVDVFSNLGELLEKNRILNSMNILIFSSSNLSSGDEIEVINEIIDLSNKLKIKVEFFTIGYDIKSKLGISKNVHIKTFPPLRREKYLKILRRFIHIALILEPKDVQNISLIPRHISKTAEMLGLGIPVVTNCSALKDYVVNGVTGYITTLDNIADTVRVLLKDAMFFKKLQLRTLIWAKKNLHYKVVANKLLSLITKHSQEDL